MKTEVISEIIKLEKNVEFSTENIENELNRRFGNVLRWAITKVDEKFITVTFTYEKAV